MNHTIIERQALFERSTDRLRDKTRDDNVKLINQIAALFEAPRFTVEYYNYTTATTAGQIAACGASAPLALAVSRLQRFQPADCACCQPLSRRLGLAQRSPPASLNRIRREKNASSPRLHTEAPSRFCLQSQGSQPLKKTCGLSLARGDSGTCSPYSGTPLSLCS